MIGTAGAELTFKIPKGWKEIDIIGDLYPWMGIATVTIDGEHCGTINNSLIRNEDQNRLKFATRSYNQLNFHSRFEESTRIKIMKVHVDTGGIRIAGFLTDELVNKPGFSYEEIDFNEDNNGDSQEEVGGNTKNKAKRNNGGIIAGAIIGSIAFLAVAMFIGVIGIRMNW